MQIFIRFYVNRHISTNIKHLIIHAISVVQGLKLTTFPKPNAQ